MSRLWLFVHVLIFFEMRFLSLLDLVLQAEWLILMAEHSILLAMHFRWLASGDASMFEFSLGFWRRFGCRLGAVLGFLGGVVGPSWAVLRASWRIFRVLWGLLAGKTQQYRWNCEFWGLKIPVLASFFGSVWMRFEYWLIYLILSHCILSDLVFEDSSMS